MNEHLIHRSTKFTWTRTTTPLHVHLINLYINMIPYLQQEGVHPFCEGLLLYGQPLLLQCPDAALFELDNILPLRHGWGVVVILGQTCE